MGFHALVAPGTPQPILDKVRTGYDGPFALAQDYTVVNITAEQIVTRQVDAKPWDYIVTDPEYAARMGGVKVDPTVMTGLPEWLEETIISVPEIEAFKQELVKMGAR
jgi:hypothetical protein